MSLVREDTFYGSTRMRFTYLAVQGLASGVLLLSGPGLLARDPAVSAAPAAAKSTTGVLAPTVPVPPIPASPDGIPLASAHAAAVREPSASGAWGGARTGAEATLSDRVVQYNIAATLDPVKHVVEGHETLVWRNRSAQEVRAVYLHLYLNAFEGDGSLFFTEKRSNGFEFRSDVPVHEGDWGHIALGSVNQGGAPVPWYFVHPDGGPDSDHTVVRLDLPTPVRAGASTTLDIAFHDQLPRVLARTGYFGSFHLVGQWFPKIGVLELPGERGARTVQWNVHAFHLHSEFYADYGAFDVKLTVPKGFTVGATGEEQGEGVETGGTVTHHFVQGDVHDFAWTADNRTARPLEGEYRGEGSPLVKVRVLYPPEYAASAAPVLKATIDALAYFSRTLGPYPYRTVTAVVPPFNAEEAGGMEYPTFFTAEGYAHPEPGTMEATFLDFVTIHEFGHGYFYGILGSNEFEEPMLDEGMNEYWDMRMMRDAGQEWHLGNRWMARLGLVPSLAPFSVSQLGAQRRDPSDALGANSWDRLNTAGYGSVYERTALTLHDLEEAVGREVMGRAMQEYYRRWKFRHPGIADLRETLAEVTGQRALVEAAFAQQAYATEKLDDAVEAFTSEEELPLTGTARVGDVWVETREEDVEKKISAQREAWDKAHPDAKEGTGPFAYRTTLVLRHRGVATPQEVVVKFVDGSVENFVWDSTERWQRYSWTRPVRAESVRIDPQGKHLLNASVLSASRTIEPEHSAARRFSSDFSALVQSLYSLLGAL